MVDIVSRIKQLEKIYGTQKQLSESLGISSRSVRNYKSESTSPRSDIRQKINQRFRYFKERTGKYKYQKIKVKDPQTGEEVVQVNRTDINELEMNEEDLNDQLGDNLEDISGQIGSGTDFTFNIEEVELIEEEVRYTPFNKGKDMDVMKGNKNFFPKRVRQ